MAAPHPNPLISPEPLVSAEDTKDYVRGLDRYLSGAWPEDRWTAFRVGHGVYGQRQPGLHMIRLKIPGGVLAPRTLRIAAEAIRRFGQGEAHITTRQDIQIYSVPLEGTAEALAYLHRHGVSTREAGGNTLRNITACPLAGVCPSQRVDAGKVAEALATAWIRHPLSQRLPRKTKIAVSGCAADCAGASFHDLAFIAGEQDGQPGFRVVAGGGLGAQPMVAAPIADFIDADDLPAAVEALMRVHHAHSDRENRARSRFKFAARKLGPKVLREVFAETFADTRRLPQRPWPQFAWRRPAAEIAPPAVEGILPQDDGRYAVVVQPRFGYLTPDQLDGLAQLADRLGVTELRLTYTQAAIFPRVAGGQVEDAAAVAARLGLPVALGTMSLPKVISCAGTSTCPIGITHSRGLAQRLLDDGVFTDVSVAVSGCHNACGLHHLADIGLHGLAKKIAGRNAPHYQIHLGGNPGRPDGLGVSGPIVPARTAPQAVERIAMAWREGRATSESLGAWAKRLGEAGLDDLLAPLREVAPDESFFVDHGDSAPFKAPATTKGDCAAPVVSTFHLNDLARDALDRMDRCLAVGLWAKALEAAQQAVGLAGQRILIADGIEAIDNHIPVFDRLRPHLRRRPSLLDVLERVETGRQIALVTGDPADYRAVLAEWVARVDAAVAAPATAGPALAAAS